MFRSREQRGHREYGIIGTTEGLGLVQTQNSNPSSPPFTKEGIPLFEKEGSGEIY
jgi:hypothetical protein